MKKKYDVEVAELLGFDNMKKTGHQGFIVRWTCKGIGFGELTVYYDKKDKKIHADSECMSDEFCKAVLDALAKVWVVH